MQVLVADDQMVTRAALKRTIIENFPEAVVFEAASCSQCIEYLNRVNFDLIVMDAYLQGQWSLAILPGVRRLQSKARLLMRSSLLDGSCVWQSLKAGASGFLTKNHSDDEMIDAITSVLTDRRYISFVAARALLEYLAVGKQMLSQSLN